MRNAICAALIFLLGVWALPFVIIYHAWMIVSFPIRLVIFYNKSDDEQEKECL